MLEAFGVKALLHHFQLLAAQRTNVIEFEEDAFNENFFRRRNQ